MSFHRAPPPPHQIQRYNGRNRLEAYRHWKHNVGSFSRDLIPMIKAAASHCTDSVARIIFTSFLVISYILYYNGDVDAAAAAAAAGR